MENITYSTTSQMTIENPIIENLGGEKFEATPFVPEGEGGDRKGGLRAQGSFKISLIDKPLISVITVVFNGEQFLEKTLLSIINQTYDNVEYIIIDGGSTDGTLDVIRKYEHAIDYWVSEPDSGIFGAMNKGVDAATGDYVYFLNAGDHFYSTSTLFDIFSSQQLQSENNEHTLVVGQVMLTVDGKEFGLANNIGTNIPHQGTFVKKSVFYGVKFDESAKIFGDAIFWESMNKAGIFTPFLTHVIVAKFPMDGVGSSPEFIWNRFNESKRILLANNDYISIGRRFILSLIGFGIYKLFGTRFYFEFYIKIVNYLIKVRG